MKRAILVLVLGAVCYGGWRLWSGGDELDGGENPALIQRYIWADKDLERTPPTEYAHLFALPDAVDDHGRHLGGVLKASHYDMHLRVFEHRLEGNRAQLKFLQEGKKGEFRFRITRCKQGVCLEMKKSPWGGSEKYFAVGEINGGGGIEALKMWMMARP
jgi:hypothetical protein